MKPYLLAVAPLPPRSAAAASGGRGVDGEVDSFGGDRADPLGRNVERLAAEEAGIDGQAHDLPVLVATDPGRCGRSSVDPGDGLGVKRSRGRGCTRERD